MRTVFATALLLAASTLLAQTSPRPTFPDDYTASPCAPANSCVSYTQPELPNAAFSFLGLDLSSKWVAANYDDMVRRFAPICRKHATCLATPGNNHLFCDDILVPEFRAVCDTAHPKAVDAKDFESCREFVEIWFLGVEQHLNKILPEAQACAHEKHLDVMHDKPPIVWIVPSTIPRGYSGNVVIYTLDPDTHVPVRADITVENQILYAPSNPAGNLAAGYPWKWPIKYNRKKNGEGHEDVVPPLVTVKAPFYPPASFPMPSTPSKMIVEMQPAKLKPGTNKVTIIARDSETGEPVEARVMAGQLVAGDTNQPIEIEVPRKGPAPEIWVTSLFDAYSDVVVVKAQQ